MNRPPTDKYIHSTTSMLTELRYVSVLCPSESLLEGRKTQQSRLAQQRDVPWLHVSRIQSFLGRIPVDGEQASYVAS